MRRDAPEPHDAISWLANYGLLAVLAVVALNLFIKFRPFVAVAIVAAFGLARLLIVFFVYRPLERPTESAGEDSESTASPP
jgi:hypothetical protein